MTDIILTHCHFDHMGSVAEFPNAMIHIQKSELLSWYEAFALPKRFRHLTVIIDPDNIRAALEASFEFRINMVDGDATMYCPESMSGWRRATPSASSSSSSIPTRAAGSFRATACTTRVQLTGHNGNGVYVPLNNAVGSVWEQLKSLDKLNDAIAGDLTNLVILHDPDRWPGLPVERSVGDFRIVRVAD